MANYLPLFAHRFFFILFRLAGVNHWNEYFRKYKFMDLIYAFNNIDSVIL